MVLHTNVVDDIATWIAEVDLVALLLRTGAVVAGVVALVVLVRVGIGIRQRLLRRRVATTYGIATPGRRVRVRMRREDLDVGRFRLVLPRWEHARADGRADRRRADNDVVRGRSVLRLGRFELSSTSPLVLYRLVRELRASGARIARSQDEETKRTTAHRRAETTRAAESVDEIVARFAAAPNGFEEFCAELFRRLGYEAEPTPPSNDGGFDLRLERDGVRTIAECKCWGRSNAITRPLVQKLVGANSVERAHNLLFITTSTFSAGAAEYAARSGVTLVDGDELVRLCRSAWPEGVLAQRTERIDFQLTDQELLRTYPPDFVTTVRR